MKKVIMIVALSLLLEVTQAAAIDYRLKGSWIMSFGYGENGRFQGAYNGHSPTEWGNGQDNFEAVQKLQFKFKAVVSKSLSGTLQIELGDTIWGRKRQEPLHKLPLI